ncbi:arsenate reductase/protein-tyrosine-phosphatase family protein [Microbacterium sp. IEGM 1404]|uniref:arsenate reductase/protein-tyrosine-phosphatase family protein n=1 Tax=Microbacterium sp. IEGM 1404 TaxID=3047084 RepID=UPI0024B6BD5F|nr:low molecular weight phosphatase family protein [Microbacterium sp. IEGM 1404]MDI9891763.1 low molecular weight phosphatase family protein [Microbacterium sp. IEGM 1404]
MTFTILTVCTGNICRSPVAELLLARGLAGFPDVAVESAGTGALVGAGIPEPALRLLSADGVDGAGHHSRQLTPALVREADLVLAMAREHRRAVVELVPAATRRTFTVRELARVAESLREEPGPRIEADDESARMRAAVLHAAGVRGMIPQPDDPRDLDVIDPYRQSDEVFRESFAQLTPAVASVIAFLSRSAGK